MGKSITMHKYDKYPIENFIGKVLKKVKVGNDYVFFHTVDDKFIVMMHNQDCCERVEIEDICGDIDDLLNTPIVQAFEKTNDKEHPADVNEKEIEYQDEDKSFTWTFYTFSTIKGTVTIRWYGTSNGYYSERANLYIRKRKDDFTKSNRCFN